MNLQLIGIVRSPFQQATGTPVQGRLAPGVEGWVEILPELAAGLRDLEGFERVWLIYWMDRAAEARLAVTPYLDREEHGIFATRSPARPNPIGLSCVRLLGVEGNRLRIGDLDILDGTPLLDIKPYVPAFDSFPAGRIGWLAGKPLEGARADSRFETNLPAPRVVAPATDNRNTQENL